VRAVLVYPELGIKIEGILRDVMTVAVIDVDAVLRDFDAEVLSRTSRAPSAISSGLCGKGRRECRQSSPSA
jgi:hypothetical protein